MAARCPRGCLAAIKAPEATIDCESIKMQASTPPSTSAVSTPRNVPICRSQVLLDSASEGTPSTKNMKQWLAEHRKQLRN
jgi:hypothetical protein